jgi:hypothetical protein
MAILCKIQYYKSGLGGALLYFVKINTCYFKDFILWLTRKLFTYLCEDPLYLSFWKTFCCMCLFFIWVLFHIYILFYTWTRNTSKTFLIQNGTLHCHRGNDICILRHIYALFAITTTSLLTLQKVRNSP